MEFSLALTQVTFLIPGSSAEPVIVSRVKACQNGQGTRVNFHFVVFEQAVATCQMQAAINQDADFVFVNADD